ncbi:unnamed protein product, partial [Prorocentrum cordatum]
ELEAETSDHLDIDHQLENAGGDGCITEAYVADTIIADIVAHDTMAELTTSGSLTVAVVAAVETRMQILNATIDTRTKTYHWRNWQTGIRPRLARTSTVGHTTDNNETARDSSKKHGLTVLGPDVEFKAAEARINTRSHYS